MLSTLDAIEVEHFFSLSTVQHVALNGKGGITQSIKWFVTGSNMGGWNPNKEVCGISVDFGLVCDVV